MKTNKTVLAEVGLDGLPIRIFRTVKAAIQLPVEQVAEFPKAFAVGVIRRKVFERAGCTPHQSGNCEECGRTIRWYAGDWDSGEMHEVIPRGKGGEVSVHNSIALCRNCHTVDATSAHGNRRWHSAKIKET